MNPEDRSNRVWFITGCSTGLGRVLAEEVLKSGGKVVATARKVEQIADLERHYPDRALALPLDVNNAAQVESAVAASMKGFGRVDVLVNNAGYGYLAAIEEGEEPEVRAMFETNFMPCIPDSRKMNMPYC